MALPDLRIAALRISAPRHGLQLQFSGDRQLTEGCQAFTRVDLRSMCDLQQKVMAAAPPLVLNSTVLLVLVPLLRPVSAVALALAPALALGAGAAAGASAVSWRMCYCCLKYDVAFTKSHGQSTTISNLEESAARLQSVCCGCGSPVVEFQLRHVLMLQGFLGCFCGLPLSVFRRPLPARGLLCFR